MPLIRPFDASDDFEDKQVPKGLYDLRITSAKLKEAGENAKTPGAKMINVSIAVEGVEGAATIFHTIFLPNDENDTAQNRRTMRDIRRFYAVFGLDPATEVDEENLSETFVGLTGNCAVDLEEVIINKQKTGDMRNVLRLPKVA